MTDCPIFYVINASSLWFTIRLRLLPRSLTVHSSDEPGELSQRLVMKHDVQHHRHCPGYYNNTIIQYNTTELVSYDPFTNKFGQRRLTIKNRKKVLLLLLLLLLLCAFTIWRKNWSFFLHIKHFNAFIYDTTENVLLHSENRIWFARLAWRIWSRY